MELADLHRHLDGSLRPDTLADLARGAGVVLPSSIGFYAGMGLEAALAQFAVTLSVLQTPAAVRRVAAEICEDAAREEVTTLEIRFAPQLHRGGAARPTDGIEAIVDAALEGIAGRAGLILCVLYGEPTSVAERLVDVAGVRPGVVGIDLAGGPLPSHATRLEDYAAAFRRARDCGLGRTVHAGEGRPAAEIRVAIEQLYAQRIGHGTTLLEDPTIVDLVLDRQVTLEACPTSNVHTGVIARVEDHPLARWLELGVRACVNPDNTLLSGVDAVEEHRRARAISGMSDELLARAVANGHAARFRRS
ncbi:MAG: adenosine deaminase family protein [Polyangiaceae bacterium]